MSGPTYNQPPVPSYGESLGEALKAQTDLLRGTGEFEGTGGLQALVREYEAPLRRETAQIDTDVLRQTLLGTERKVVRDPETGKFGIPGAEPVGQQQFRIEESFTEKLNGKGVTQFDLVNPNTGDLISREFISDKTPAEARLELSKNKQFTKGFSEADIERLKNPDTDFASANFGGGEPQTAGGGRYQIVMQQPSSIAPNAQFQGATDVTGAVYTIIDIETGGVLDSFGGEVKRLPSGSRGAVGEVEAEFNEAAIKSAVAELGLLQDTIDTDGLEAVTREFEFTNPNIPADPSKAGQEGFDSEGRALLQEGQVVREGDGMIDLLGDRRQAIDPATGLPSGRQAGFDEQGNFLGLSALAEDVQRGNLSRQREADLADVERLSGRFQDVMADYRPGTTEALAGAREVLEAQRQRLVGQPASGQADKSDLFVLNRSFNEIEEEYQSALDQYGPEAADAMRAASIEQLQNRAEIAGLTMDQVQAGPQAQPAQLTGFQDPTFTAETQLTGDAGLLGVLQSATQADVDAGRATRVGETIQVDPLRARLIQDARSALGEGLTEREERQIAEAARARATMMGRTFDQSEAIAEAQARVAEDNQRRMQNRAFASQILGQEAGLQSGDLGRGMQQELRQVGADMDAERLRQAQTAGFIDASTRLAGLEASTTMDPFAALLNRAGGGSLGQAGQVLGQAGYGLASGPQYLNPEAGLGFISQMAANEASMYGANVAADAAIKSGLYQGIGSAVGGGLQGYLGKKCWVAREVYGPLNPQWLQFRSWLDTEAPNWFYNLYLKFGERFANWISDKPRIKAIIRRWMDSKIRG
tara:strand:+ start:1009 stop:3459 length:2451 start_codon:yes stop_codon:yes gene_type:complete